jgi:HSP90 family molecular chaperone
MSAPSETIPSIAQTILNLLKEVKSKVIDDTTQVRSLDTACCLAEAAADITSEVRKIAQGNADNDALDSARASVINADMTISATIEQCDDSETRERLGSIAGCLQRNVRKIKKRRRGE